MSFAIELPEWFELIKVFHLPAEKPLAKMRAKAFKLGEHIKFYNPQKEEEDAVKAEVLKQMAGSGPAEGPLFVSIIFYIPRPKADYGTGKNAGAVKPSAPYFHIKKPDEDNLSKFYKDVMNKIVYSDDAQVCGCFTWKQPSKNGGTVIKIYRLHKPETG
jgi:Holliday junction resolvase RusA-like endonuclease